MNDSLVYYLRTENEKLPPNIREKILSRDGKGCRTNPKVIKIIKIFPDERLSDEYFGPRYWKIAYRYNYKEKRNVRNEWKKIRTI